MGLLGLPFNQSFERGAKGARVAWAEPNGEAERDSSTAIAKYGAGLPWYRLARMQEAFGVPMPESVQFERCEAVADAALPVFLYLQRLAADGEVVYSDDTRVKILSCIKENEELEEEERRATNTSGIVVKLGGRWIALYVNGRRHAGENLDELLKKRSAELEAPIQMSDAFPGQLERRRRND